MSFTAILLQLPVGHCFGVFAYVTDILATIGVALRHGRLRSIMIHIVCGFLMTWWTCY